MSEIRPGLTLRPMTPADLAQVLTIEQAGQPTPWSAGIFEDCFRPGYRAEVVLSGDTVVAFQVLSSVLDEVHLLNIAVHPDWQRQGIARALLEHTLRGLRDEDMSVFYLEVRAGNLAAQALYLQLGFSITGERRDYYRNAGGREDAVLMLRHL